MLDCSTWHLWCVTAALWPRFAHYFCCFLCCGSLLIYKQLLHIIATLLKSKVTHPKYSFMQLAGKISTSEGECTSGEKCTLSCVFLYIPMHQHAHNFWVDMDLPWVCAECCTIHWLLRDVELWGFLTCQERGSQVMWCINEELWLQEPELSTHIICMFPPLRQSVGKAKVRSQSYFWTLWFIWKIWPCGRILDLCTHYLASVISNKSPVFKIKKQKRTTFHFQLSFSEGSGYTANGHSPGMPSGRKASNHINLNSWLLPVGWLLTDGELSVMFLTSLKLTQINLRPSHCWLQGSARWSLMIIVKSDGKSTNKPGAATAWKVC